ncbi:MAG: hypothetical protein H7141_09485 [Burkholderiales bacterium]|nr:hypothetical protein [Bacteroidia bacterium]
MKELKLIQDEITGLVHVKEDSQYNSINADLAILAENVKVRFFGQVGDVILKKGSLLYVHGTVSGKVENMGGVIHVFNN